ncbi:MAG: cob(I)yrinic acid a,c-diamide adenosyltransferase [Patescibacteria group bacterium]
MPAVKRKKAPKTVPKLQPFPGGLTICYVGNGKGKTTAAVGVAVRAAGDGKRVLFFQFFKSPEWPSGERESLRKLGIQVEVHGKGFVGIWGDKKPKAEHQAAARAALGKAKRLLIAKKFDVIILDELISCVEEGLLSVKDVVALIQAKRDKAKNLHLVLTGHTKYSAILKVCDVVSEMQMVKHPFYQGFLAVKGIDY